MTKKAKYLFLIISIFFLVGCSLSSPISATETASETTSEMVSGTDLCDFSIPITSDVPAPKPGDTVYLIAEVDSNTFGWTFHWQAEPAILLEDDSVSSSLIVPNGVIQIEVEVEAIDADGCVGSGDLLILVDVPTVEATEGNEEVTATAVVISEATPMPTPMPTLTPTAVPTEPTPTEESTEVPTATATATSEPLPTLPPAPTATPISTPYITYLELLPGGTVVLHWSWDGTLTDTQNFAVRFWSQQDPRPDARYSITWTKGFDYQFTVNNVDFPIGTYLINVAVMEGPSEGIHTEVVRSDDRPLFVDAPPPPPTPPPLP